MEGTTRKIVTLRNDQIKWIEDNDIQYSRFARRCLDKAMKETQTITQQERTT